MRFLLPHHARFVALYKHISKAQTYFLCHNFARVEKADVPLFAASLIFVMDYRDKLKRWSAEDLQMFGLK